MRRERVAPSHEPEESALSSQLRIVVMKYRKMKAAISIEKELMRPFVWLSCAQFVHS
jgi:predicted DNA-binding ribbon-helix-helix protein